VVRVRQSAQRLRTPMVAVLALALAVPISLAWGGAAMAAPSAGDLQSQLRKLNGDADQAVERYLEAQIALKQTKTSLGTIQNQVAEARGQLDALRGLVSARAADAYMFGPADVALMLNPGAADDTLDRMQTLTLLAQRASDELQDLTVADRAFQTEMARLTKVERDREAQLKRLAAEKDRVDKLVVRTQSLLGELRQAGGAAALDGVDPGLPAGSAPPPPSGGGGGGAAAVRYAYAQLGKPYAFGADGPGTFDCSGLTMMAWRQAGVSLPHSSASQYNVGRRVSAGELQPGDLVFYYSPISHVSVYIGNGQRISATHTGDYVRVQSLGSSIVGYARPNG